MKFFVSRQCEYPDGDNVVEIATGGLDYANPGMLGPRWASLGEGQEFTDPREAVEAAINVRDQWQKLLQHNGELPDIDISFGSTGGFTLPLPRMSDDELKEKADKLYEKLPKCDECGELLGKETYTHDYAMNDEKFCRTYCAEKNYNSHISSETEDDIAIAGNLENWEE